MNKYFENIGIFKDNILSLSPKEAYNCCQKGAILVDIRKSYETDYKSFKVDNLILIPKNTFTENFEKIPMDKQVIIADSTGLSSKKAVMFLAEKGYKNVANLVGGIMQWERTDLPVVVNNKEALAKPSFYDSKPKNFVKTTLVKNND